MLKKLIMIIFYLILIQYLIFGYSNISSCNSNLNIDGEEYRLNQNILCTSTAISINASNVILDCQNYNINNSIPMSEMGIVSTNFENITIQNCNVNFFLAAVVITNSTNLDLNNINIKNNGMGLYLINVSQSQILNIKSHQNINGAVLLESENNLINGMNASNNSNFGFLLDSVNISIVNSFFNFNPSGLLLTGNSENVVVSSSDLRYNADDNLWFEDLVENNHFYNNYLGDSCKINTLSGNWIGYLTYFNNSQYGNSYSDKSCFYNSTCLDASGNACDYIQVIQSSNPAHQKTNIFPFGNLVISMILISFFVFWRR